MLNYLEKISILEVYLSLEENSYADIMKNELYFHFFINEFECSFLNLLFSKEEIVNKIDFVVTKMILHENESAKEQIIENYLSI